MQIARILVENALVHTPRGTHVWIEVSEDRGRRAARRLGRRAWHRTRPRSRHVFDRFYRVDGTQASGSGLGLAIARELVRLMGGSLELESLEGRTTFALMLPAADIVCRQRDTDARAKVAA